MKHASMPRALIGLAWIVVTCLPAVVQPQNVAVVIRPAVLRSGPSSSSQRVARLAVGDVVELTATAHHAGYARVRAQDEEVGWVYERNIQPLDPTEVHHPVAPHDTMSAPEPHPVVAHDSATAPPSHLPVANGDFDGCPAVGTVSPNGPHPAALEALNKEKNRSATPGDADLDPAVTLAALLAPSSDDTHRFSETRGAEIVGLVLHVKPGGKSETGNCKKGDPVHRDSHIELVPSPTDTAETRRVIVEVTPRWRAAANAQGIDWSTNGLQHAIEGKWIRVRGWLMFDGEHANQSENTHPNGSTNWRATAWEIHPVSSFVIVPHP